VASKIMLALELLSDGKWHRTEELLLKLELNEHKLQEVTAFLRKYGFVEIDKKNRKVKINKDFRNLVTQTIK
jgi:DNA-binding IscR family transcriptional regulator